MKIALQLAWLNNGQHKNFIGDAAVADAWQKYLRRMGHTVNIFGERVYDADIAGHDVVIHWWPWLKQVPNTKNILFMQNALSREDFGTNTVGVFKSVADRFDGYIYLSETLKKNCGRDGLVLPFAADEEVFTYTPDEKFAYPVSHVGNDIKGDAVNEKYLIPAIPHGLVMHGGQPFRDARLAACWRGRLSTEDLVKCYSSSRVNLNTTHPEHVKNGVVNSRVFEVLACGGNCLTDKYPGDLADYCFTDDKHGWDGGWGDMLRMFVNSKGVIQSQVEGRRDFILEKHTYAHRMASLMTWLKEVV